MALIFSNCEYCWWRTFFKTTEGTQDPIEKYARDKCLPFKLAGYIWHVRLNKNSGRTRFMKNQVVIITLNNLIILESFFVSHVLSKSWETKLRIFLVHKASTLSCPLVNEIGQLWYLFIFRYKGHHPYLSRAKHGFSLDLDYRFKYVLD